MTLSKELIAVCRGKLLLRMRTGTGQLGAPPGKTESSPDPLGFRLEEVGSVHVVIDDEEDGRLRNLVADRRLEGANTIWWDGRDETSGNNECMALMGPFWIYFFFLLLLIQGIS